VYCKLVRESEAPERDREKERERERGGEGEGEREFVMVWESHQFQWALKTELLVACALPLCRHPLYPNPLALLSIREPIASRGNDGCKPSRTCFPISSKNTDCTPAKREYVERMNRKRNALRNINDSIVFFFVIISVH